MGIAVPLNKMKEHLMKDHGTGLQGVRQLMQQVLPAPGGGGKPNHFSIPACKFKQPNVDAKARKYLRLEDHLPRMRDVKVRLVPLDLTERLQSRAEYVKSDPKDSARECVGQPTDPIDEEEEEERIIREELVGIP